MIEQYIQHFILLSIIHVLNLCCTFLFHMQFMMANEVLVRILIHTDVTKYLNFKAVDGSFVYNKSKVHYPFYPSWFLLDFVLFEGKYRWSTFLLQSNVFLFRFTRCLLQMLKPWNLHWWDFLKKDELENSSSMYKITKTVIQSLMKGWTWTRLLQEILFRNISFSSIESYDALKIILLLLHLSISLQWKGI